MEAKNMDQPKQGERGVQFKIEVPELPDSYEGLMKVLDAPPEPISMLVIRSGLTSFVGKVFLLADEWAKEEYPGYFCGIRNTPDGAYEIVLSPPETK